MTECSMQAELKEAQEIIEAFREDNVRLENELREIKSRMSDVDDFCDILLLMNNRSVKILVGIMKKIIEGKKESPCRTSRTRDKSDNNFSIT